MANFTQVKLELCEQAGIFYDSADVPEILAEDREDVRKAIALAKRGAFSAQRCCVQPFGHENRVASRREAQIAYLENASRKKLIKNRAGYLRKCLKYRWWESKSAPSFEAALIALVKYLGVGNG